jgi:hypothetical protein
MSPPTLSYAPPLQEDQIRVLVIRPAEHAESKIECGLKRTRISSPCEYTCLSYSCSDRDDGVVEFCETILCDGVEVWVTKGAHHALRRFRMLGGERIWVDAICIDQRNDNERSQQVSIMAEIYTAARTVFVWAGEESDHGDGRHAMTCFAGLGSLSHWKKDWRKEVPEPRDVEGLRRFLVWSWFVGRWSQSQSTGPFQLHQTTDTSRQPFQIPEQALADPPQAPFTFSTLSRQYGQEMGLVPQPLLSYILRFLRRRWFGRRWILQETHRARSISLHCGAMSLDFATFRTAIEELGDRTDELWRVDSSWDFASVYRARHIVDLRTWGEVRGAFIAKSYKRKIGETPTDVMYRFSDFDCADDRDRVFALLSFFECPTIPPDYLLTVEETYHAFARSLLDNGQLGKTLWQAAIRTAKDPSGVLALPSWVPDWRNGTSISMDLWPTDSEARYQFGSNICDAEYHMNADGSLSLQAWTTGLSFPSREPMSFERCPCSNVGRTGLLKGCIYASMPDRRLMSDNVAITHGDVRAGDLVLALFPLGEIMEWDFIVIRSVCSDSASYRVVGWCFVSFDSPLLQTSLRTTNLKIV